MFDKYNALFSECLQYLADCLLQPLESICSGKYVAGSYTRRITHNQLVVCARKTF